MEAYYKDDTVQLYLDTDSGCLAILPTLADASVDAVVCDPPYELGFMGKAWDASGIAYNTEVWRQCWRVLKPGGHLLAFGGTRTYHRMTVAIEDAGFEIRDSLHWIYGSGMPKGQNVGKAIDKAAGAKRQVIGTANYPGREGWTNSNGPRSAEVYGVIGETRLSKEITAPATDDAARWEGWNTQLRPAHEPIVLARKSTGFNTTVANVLKHGTGALNIDGCRTEAAGGLATGGSLSGHRSSLPMNADREVTENRERSPEHPAGRWPANILLGHGPDCIDGGDCQPGCPVAEMDAQSGVLKSGSMKRGAGLTGAVYGSGRKDWAPDRGYTDSGGASRFFPVFRYEAKAPASERPRLADGTAHTTVKPLALMQWLVRLVTPPGGTVLDPFAGSGTTLEACRLESFRSIGIEMDAAHAELCRVRLDKPYMVDLFGGGAA